MSYTTQSFLTQKWSRWSLYWHLSGFEECDKTKFFFHLTFKHSKAFTTSLLDNNHTLPDICAPPTANFPCNSSSNSSAVFLPTSRVLIKRPASLLVTTPAGSPACSSVSSCGETGAGEMMRGSVERLSLRIMRVAVSRSLEDFCSPIHS